MSPALSDLPVRKITRVLESLGFVYVRTKGSHAVYRHPDGRAVVVPNTAPSSGALSGQFCGKPVSRLPSSSNCFIDAQLDKRVVVRGHNRVRSILSCTVDIVKRTDTISGFLVLRRRWVVARTFGWITKHHRCVRDYETLPQHHEAMVTIAMIMVMSRCLARTGDW